MLIKFEEIKIKINLYTRQIKAFSKWNNLHINEYYVCIIICAKFNENIIGFIDVFREHNISITKILCSNYSQSCLYIIQLFEDHSRTKNILLIN